MEKIAVILGMSFVGIIIICIAWTIIEYIFNSIRIKDQNHKILKNIEAYDKKNKN
jgi:hypothetical protein